jgi:hypothetical protein
MGVPSTATGAAITFSALHLNEDVIVCWARPDQDVVVPDACMGAFAHQAFLGP